MLYVLDNVGLEYVMMSKRSGFFLAVTSLTWPYKQIVKNTAYLQVFHINFVFSEYLAADHPNLLEMGLQQIWG